MKSGSATRWLKQSRALLAPHSSICLSQDPLSGRLPVSGHPTKSLGVGTGAVGV
jgi:hypothetical protein